MDREGGKKKGKKATTTRKKSQKKKKEKKPQSCRTGEKREEGDKGKGRPRFRLHEKKEATHQDLIESQAGERKGGTPYVRAEKRRGKNHEC